MNYDILVQDLFRAYYDARKNKRGKAVALSFELKHEAELIRLAGELADGQYQIGPSNCFMVFKPVKREVFAASFRDRIVHHLIYNYINPIFDRKFIYDSYSCRTSKGTSLGIKWNLILNLSRNRALQHHDQEKLIASLNSYFGMLKQFNTYKLRRKIITEYLESGALINLNYQ